MILCYSAFERRFMGTLIRKATEQADRATSRHGVSRLFWLIFLLTLSVRLTYVFGLKTYTTIEGSELVLVARSLADTNTFGNPYKIRTGPTANVAPAYPFLLSLIYRILGHGVAGEVAQEVLCSIVTSVQYALLPLASVAAGLPLYIGATAGLLGAVLPLRLWMETKGSWETAYAALALVGLFLLTMYYWNRRNFSLRAGAVQGLAWGGALLLVPAFLPILFGFLLSGVSLLPRRDRIAYIRSSIALIVGVILALTPWTIRNYYQLGGFVPIRSVLGLQLSINHPELGRKRSPFLNLEEATKLKQMG